MTKHNYSRWKKKKRESKSRASRSKEDQGIFRCRVTIHRSTHPHSFINQPVCYTSLGFPGRCQLLLYTIRWGPCIVSEGNTKRVCPTMDTEICIQELNYSASREPTWKATMTDRLVPVLQNYRSSSQIISRQLGVWQSSNDNWKHICSNMIISNNYMDTI